MTTATKTDAQQRDELARRAAWDAQAHTDAERAAENKRRLEWDHGVGTTASTAQESGALMIANNVSLLLNDIGAGMTASQAETVKLNIRVELNRLRSWGANPSLPLAPTERDDAARIAAAREEGAASEGRRRDAANAERGTTQSTGRTHTQAERDEESKRRAAWDRDPSSHTPKENETEKARRAAWDRA